MYKIISAKSPETLAEKVNKQKNHPDRWSETGGIFAQGTGKDAQFFQAMSRVLTTPLMEDLKNELTDEHAKIMIEAGADVNAQNQQKITPLMLASAFSRTEIVELLISKKAAINARDEEGNTPLHWAVCHSDNVENVQLLIKTGANVNASTLGGYTVLMSALINTKNPGIIRCLIDNGADVNAKHNYFEIKDVTPLMIALENKWTYPVIKMLLDAGAKVNAKDSCGENPWIYATKHGCDEKVLDLLIEYGAVKKHPYSK